MNIKNLKHITIYTLIIMAIMAIFTLIIGPRNFKGYSNFLFYGSVITIFLSTVSFFAGNERKRHRSIKSVKEQDKSKAKENGEKVDKKNRKDIKEFGYRMFVVFFILILLSRYIYYI